MTGRRIKLILLLASAALAGLTLAAWTQTWFTLELDQQQSVTAAGSVAAPALTALALSQLVLVGAIAIAGRFFRVVLGVVQVLLGATIALSAGIAVAGPVAASGAVVSQATGIEGADAIADLVQSVSATAWPALSLVAGILIAVVGGAIVATSATWPGSTRKYQAVRMEPASTDRTSVDDWDSLTGGEDPTR